MGDRKVAERRWTDAEHIALAEKQLDDAYRYFDKPDPLTAAILAAAHGAVALLASRPTTPDNEPVRRAINAETAELQGENKLLRAKAGGNRYVAVRLIATLRHAIDNGDATSDLRGVCDAAEHALFDDPSDAIPAVTADLLDENKRLWAENERLRARLAELINAVGGFNTPAIRDQIERAVAVIHGEPVPSTGEDQDLPDSARARAGMTVVHKSGSRHVLSHRKGDDSGWWLADKGRPAGVADWMLDRDDWQLIFEPVPDEGSAPVRTSVTVETADGRGIERYDEVARHECPFCGQELVEVDSPLRRELRHRRGAAQCPGPAVPSGEGGRADD